MTVDRRFREVLLQLALCSNGRTTSWSPTNASTSAAGQTPRLGRSDAPELELARAYDRATSDVERQALLDEAIATLDSIRHAPATAVAGETKAERDARIVEHGEGLPASEVAIAMRCGVRDVWTARAANGRDPEFGRPCLNGGSLTKRERQARVLELTAEGMTARNVARVLGVHYDTVRRDLGRRR